MIPADLLPWLVSGNFHATWSDDNQQLTVTLHHPDGTVCRTVQMRAVKRT